jgi:hypothetical protein
MSLRIVVLVNGKWYTGLVKTPTDPVVWTSWVRGPTNLKNTATFLGYLGLGPVLLTEGSILNPCCGI